MKERVCPVNAPYSPVEALGSAVVQIVSQVAEFNWLEPYRSSEQGERRGSGFFINRDGYVITNAHVVDQAKSVYLHIPMLGRHMIPASIVGICPDRDIALLKVEESVLTALKTLSGDVPALQLGNSDTVHQGDPIIAFGYPLGDYRLKVSPGVVSGFEGFNGQSLIQITSPINPGNSGGPLVDEQGTVVGIVVAKQHEACNVGYALPINEVSLILEELYTKRLVRKPALGAIFVYSNDQKAAFLGNPLPAGVYISRVVPHSLFLAAGVQEGDMLYSFNGFELDAYGETLAPWGAERVSLYDLIARLQRGQNVPFVVYRKGERKEMSLIFEETEPPVLRVMYPDFEDVEYEVFGGLVIMELTLNHIPLLFEAAPELMVYQRPEYLFEKRLIITHIIPGSLAQQARFLTIGDEIATVNGKQVKTIKQLHSVLNNSIASGFIALTTKRAAVSVFSLKEMVQDEVRLSSDYTYPLSPLMRKLIKKLNIIA